MAVAGIRKGCGFPLAIKEFRTIPERDEGGFIVGAGSKSVKMNWRADHRSYPK
jgi:hypothetical protein